MDEDVVNGLALQFVRLAGEYIRGLEIHLSPRTLIHRFVSHFGVSPRLCAFIWYVAETRLIQEDAFIERKHLLWTLNILKTDDAEHVLKGRWSADEKTIRKWMYVCLNVIARLGLVSGMSSVLAASFDALESNINIVSFIYCYDRLILITGLTARACTWSILPLTELTFQLKNSILSLDLGMDTSSMGQVYAMRLEFALQLDGLCG